jgi:hypothetical protein
LRRRRERRLDLAAHDRQDKFFDAIKGSMPAAAEDDVP